LKALFDPLTKKIQLRGHRQRLFLLDDQPSVAVRDGSRNRDCDEHARCNGNSNP